MSNQGDILIIDDDPLVLMNYSDILEEAGYNPVTAASLAQGWSQMSNRSFDLIICDHDLPDGKGLDLINKMLQHNKIQPVIYLSAALPAVLNEVKKMQPVKQVLTKPIDNDTLIEAVNASKELISGQNYPRLVGLDERRMLLDDSL